jgi:putative membrane protein
MNLNEEGRAALAARIREVEQRSGAQVLVVVSPRARPYPEIVWRGFALGVALGAAASALAVAWRSSWGSPADLLRLAATCLGAGLLGAALATRVPALTRALLDGAASEIATRDRARALFVEHGVHTTQRRIGVLVSVSLLERRVELVPDVGLAHLPPAAWHEVVAAMRPALRARQLGTAFHAALEVLERALQAAGVSGASEGNELARELVVADEERTP